MHVKIYWLGIDFGKITLNGAIDNATGTVCGLYFYKHETLNGYYHLFERIWRKYGVPAKFLTDNRTVFIYNGLKQKSMEKDTLTQFGRRSTTTYQPHGCLFRANGLCRGLARFLAT